MRKMRSMVLSCIVIMIIVIIICPNALAQNSCTDECHYIVPAQWENSYAWDQQYIFTAQGYYFKDQQEYCYTWGTPHYRICRIDRLTGECTVLIEDYPYHAIDLMLFGEDVYILRKYNDGNVAMLKHMLEDGTYDVLPVIEDGEKYGTFYLVKMDRSGKMLGKTRFDLDQSVLDHVMCGQRMYMALSGSIVYLDMETMEITQLYTAETEIRNQKAYSHMIIEDDVLYVQDGKAIVGVDIYTGEVRAKCVLDPYIDWMYPYRCFDYVVLDHQLYYWNEANREMTVLNLENGEQTVISRDRYFFVQPTREGIVVARIKEEYLQTIYDHADDTTWKYTTVNGADVPECSEFMFFAFKDIEHPTFDPSMDDALTVMDDFKYSVVFLDQMQYIDGDLNIRMRKS